MKLTKCPNGHFYDGEKYSHCPHCEGGGAGGQNSTIEMTLPSYAVEGEGGIPVTGKKGQMDDPPSIGTDTIDRMKEQMDLRSRDRDDAKTVGMDYLVKPSGENDREEQRIRPVVGWLVGIFGSCRGKSFPLYGGQNYIGRSEQMDICLKGDQSISKNRHAIVIYDPRHRMYFANPGESSQLYYVNGQVVLSARELKDRDVLEIGNSQFLFVPLCDSRFSWDTPVPLDAGL